MYGFEGASFLLPRFVTDCFFISEFFRRYLYSSSFFKQKHKKQFIQIPISVGNACVKSLFHLREVTREFETCEFSEGPAIQGFDLEGIFMAHLNFIGYTNLFEIFIPWEIQENRSPETIISTNVKVKHSKLKIR